MNCKPGDVAFIVKSPDQSNAWADGRVVRCLSSFIEVGYVCWFIERPLISPSGEVFVSVYDGVLRPFRDPGDDAIDESKAWLPPVPLPTIDPSLLPAKAHA